MPYYLNWFVASYLDAKYTMDTSGEVRLVFVVGWSEEKLLTHLRVLNQVDTVEPALLPERCLFETKKGDAIIQPEYPGCEQHGAVPAHGLLVQPRSYVAPFQLLELLYGVATADTVWMCEAVRAQDMQPCKAFAMKKHFPVIGTPGTLIASGKWLQRTQPFPLVTVTAEELSSIRHIFAYGTLRHDDTSGASWTHAFNDGLASKPATVRGLSLYLLGYPIVLIPRDESQPNEGVVGCVAHCDAAEMFSSKLAMADGIEGCPSEYRRGVVRAELKDGSHVLAFIYYRVPSAFRDLTALKKSRIASGNFLRRGAAYEF